MAPVSRGYWHHWIAMEGSFVAIGDSFTEGLDDPYPDGSFRGWADRLAEMLAARDPGLRYANLAIRGKVLREVAEEQVPVAIGMGAELVSIAAGGNDLLRPGGDPDGLAAAFDSVVARLQEAGCRVLMFTGFDPCVFPVIRLIRGKAAAYNMHLRSIADARGCDLVEMWSMRVLCDKRLYSVDRLHLSSEGHRRVALRAAEVLGLPVTEDWRTPLPELASAPVPAPARAAWLAARRADAEWARLYAVQWLRRRLRGTSSGDGILAKRPELLPVNDPASA
jgi:lysophospholipase L1-like esterase